MIKIITSARAEYDLLFDADFREENPEISQLSIPDVIEYSKAVETIDKIKEKK